MNELVFKGENNQVLTTSLKVAEVFNKDHQHVLRDIRTLCEGMSSFGETPMFVEMTYTHEQNGQQYPMFVMNRDGFTLLAMGFTGKKALKFKIDYINAFNNMEKMLKEQSEQKPLSMAEMFALQANINLEQERRVKQLESRLDAIEKERRENTAILLSVHTSTEKLPELSMRDNIRQLVNSYSSSKNVSQRDVWHSIYSQLYYLYHISIRNYKKGKGETNLDVAEKNNFLDKIFNVISNMVRELK